MAEILFTKLEAPYAAYILTILGEIPVLNFSTVDDASAGCKYVNEQGNVFVIPYYYYYYYYYYYNDDNDV